MRTTLAIAAAFFFVSAAAFAQSSATLAPLPETTITESSAKPPATGAPSSPDVAEPKPREYEDMPQVRVRILDKVRAESRTYDLNVGRTVAYANIRIRPRSCRKSSPLDDPESASFLQVWEVKPDGTSGWIFSGWMFASSPSLSAMDHPVYDVTVLDCKNPLAESQSDSKETTDKPVESTAAAPKGVDKPAKASAASKDAAPASEKAAPAQQGSKSAAPADEETPASAEGTSTNETPDSDNASDSDE